MDAKVFSVQQISLGYTKNIPPSVIIGAAGTVPTTGWSEARLVPWIYIAPPADGIWDFDFIAKAPSGIALQVLSPIASAPFIAEVPEWFKGVRVHASTNVATELVDSQVTLTQFSAASLGGGDFFPWASKDNGGADGFPWSVAGDESLRSDTAVLARTIGSLTGGYVRTYTVSNPPKTEDFRQDRINFVVEDNTPKILRIHIG